MIDYIIQNLWILWLTLSFVCLISELTGGDLYFVCFSIGALFSLVLAAVGLPFWSQVLLWAVASRGEDTHQLGKPANNELKQWRNL